MWVRGPLQPTEPTARGAASEDLIRQYEITNDLKYGNENFPRPLDDGRKRRQKLSKTDPRTNAHARACTPGHVHGYAGAYFTHSVFDSFHGLL